MPGETGNGAGEKKLPRSIREFRRARRRVRYALSWPLDEIVTFPEQFGGGMRLKNGFSAGFLQTMAKIMSRLRSGIPDEFLAALVVLLAPAVSSAASGP